MNIINVLIGLVTLVIGVLWIRIILVQLKGISGRKK